LDEPDLKNKNKLSELQRENEELRNKIKFYENKSSDNINKEENKRINDENLQLIEELEELKARVFVLI
jgi:hypothetical protein